MKNLGLIKSQPLFLLDFCFINVDFSATTISTFDAFLINLFLLIHFFEPILPACFLQIKQLVCMFYNDGNIFLATFFKHFDSIK